MTYTFSGAIASFITEEWELVQHTIAFEPIFDEDHQGAYAARNLAHRLAELGIIEEIVAITLDNARVNDTLVATLARLIREEFHVPFVRENAQVRCLPHVGNIIVQEIMAALGLTDSPDDVDHFRENKGEYIDPELAKELEEWEREVEGMDEEEIDALLSSKDRDFLASLYGDSADTPPMGPLQKVCEAVMIGLLHLC